MKGSTIIQEKKGVLTSIRLTFQKLASALSVWYNAFQFSVEKQEGM